MQDFVRAWHLVNQQRNNSEVYQPNAAPLLTHNRFYLTRSPKSFPTLIASTPIHQFVINITAIGAVQTYAETSPALRNRNMNWNEVSIHPASISYPRSAAPAETSL